MTKLNCTNGITTVDSRNVIQNYQLQYAGSWDTGLGLVFTTTKRPNWFRQKITYILLGWKWKENK